MRKNTSVAKEHSMPDTSSAPLLFYVVDRLRLSRRCLQERDIARWLDKIAKAASLVQLPESAPISNSVAPCVLLQTDRQDRAEVYVLQSAR